MAYPVELLTTVADCDLVLAAAAEERAEIDYRQTQLQHLHTVGVGRSTELNAALTGATTEYNVLGALLPTMAEGNTKKKNEREYKRLEYRIYVLGEQQASGENGVIAQFKRKYEINCITRQFEENDTLKAEVEARRTVLQG
ncbi:hypothetical protein [Hymenobacter lucidus]|uniref:DUF2383 domain-containing protein n=1 Tax=Hymenobacter lucidus TaxID=2880930 RepID=A0ABS8AR95_9BACT|nr:hypothetical protein [Hymenobacter lucidus]MCB2408614.1 hypothetical protein [Hymenobacter lucidus]